MSRLKGDESVTFRVTYLTDLKFSEHLPIGTILHAKELFDYLHMSA